MISPFRMVFSLLCFILLFNLAFNNVQRFNTEDDLSKDYQLDPLKQENISIVFDRMNKRFENLEKLVTDAIRYNELLLLELERNINV
jgi:hypothetical protein